MRGAGGVSWNRVCVCVCGHFCTAGTGAQVWKLVKELCPLLRICTTGTRNPFSSYNNRNGNLLSSNVAVTGTMWQHRLCWLEPDDHSSHRFLLVVQIQSSSNEFLELFHAKQKNKNKKKTPLLESRLYGWLSVFTYMRTTNGEKTLRRTTPGQPLHSEEVDRWHDVNARETKESVCTGVLSSQVSENCSA